MNQARNMTADNTLLMRIASKLYMKMTAPGWPGDKSHHDRVSQPEKTGQPG